MTLPPVSDIPQQPPAERYVAGFREGFRSGFRDGLDEARKRDDGKHESDHDEDAPATDKGEDEKKGKPLHRRPVPVALALLATLVLLIAAIVFWRDSRRHESTDDAFIDGYASQVAAQTAGQVTHLYVVDNQHVNAGDPIVDIDSRDTDARTDQARAQLANTQGQYEQAVAQVSVQRASAIQADAAIKDSEAKLKQAELDLGRYRAVDSDAVPRQSIDNAETTERSAKARLDADRANARAAHEQVDAALAQVRAAKSSIEAARAQLAAAELQGSYTHVVAPVAGRITRRSVDVGNVVANGQALVALVSDVLWVTANFKETQLALVRPGQPVDITVDAYPDVQFHGHVDSIQRATGQYFSMLPAENATGNYVKVVQRVPVKIVFDDDRLRDYAIGPGMSVVPTVTVR